MVADSIKRMDKSQSERLWSNINTNPDRITSLQSVEMKEQNAPTRPAVGGRKDSNKKCPVVINVNDMSDSAGTKQSVGSRKTGSKKCQINVKDKEGPSVGSKIQNAEKCLITARSDYVATMPSVGSWDRTEKFKKFGVESKSAPTKSSVGDRTKSSGKCLISAMVRGTTTKPSISQAFKTRT